MRRFKPDYTTTISQTKLLKAPSFHVFLGNFQQKLIVKLEKIQNFKKIFLFLFS
jgi:hypothetical protein